MTTITDETPLLYRPADAADVLGIADDTVTYHIRKRPRLFPPRSGGRHEWTPEEFALVLRALRCLSGKARRP